MHRPSLAGRGERGTHSSEAYMRVMNEAGESERILKLRNIVQCRFPIAL